MNLRSLVLVLPGVLAPTLVALPVRADPTGPQAPAQAAPVAPLAPVAVLVAAPPPPDPQPPKMRSRGMLIGGLVATGVGATLLVSGGVLYANDSSPNPCTPTAWFCGFGRGLGTSLMIAGGVSTAVGLPLAIVGGSPRYTSTAAIPSWTPAVSVGPGAASLRWTF